MVSSLLQYVAQKSWGLTKKTLFIIEMVFLALTVIVGIIIPVVWAGAILVSDLHYRYIIENKTPFGQDQNGSEWMSEDGKLHFFPEEESSRLEGTLTVDGVTYEVQFFPALQDPYSAQLLFLSDEHQYSKFWCDCEYISESSCRITVRSIEPSKPSLPGYEIGDSFLLEKVNAE